MALPASGTPRTATKHSGIVVDNPLIVKKSALVLVSAADILVRYGTSLGDGGGNAPFVGEFINREEKDARNLGGLSLLCAKRLGFQPQEDTKCASA